MKSKQHLLKLATNGFKIFCLALVVTLTVVACKKSFELTSSTDVFNADGAKEWYYGTFIKSAEWASSPLRKKKLPDWEHGVYRRIGNMELVEFPLVTAKKSITIPSEPLLTMADKKRITESSLSRISFIKKSDKTIVVREVDYIPCLFYLQDKGFDISATSLLKPDNDFSGRIVIKNWKGDVVSIKTVAKGTVIRSGKIKSQIPSANRAFTANDEGECPDREVCLFELICDVTTYPDGLEVLDNCEWINTGFCWFEEQICPPNPCEGMSAEECACRLYGICDDGGGGDDEEVETVKTADYEWTVQYIDSAFGGGYINSTDHLVAKFNNRKPEKNRFLGGSSSHVNLYWSDWGQNSTVGYSNTAASWTVNSNTQLTLASSGTIRYNINNVTFNYSGSKAISLYDCSWHE